MNKNQIQTEALAKISPLKLSGVNISMGVGKTLLGLKDMSANYHPGARFLVVAPKKTIYQSWLDETVEHQLEFLQDHIVYSTYRSLTKQDLDYDVIYLDECHSLKYSHSAWLTNAMRKGIRIVGLTGTYPNYKKSEKGEMCAQFCPLVYEYVIDNAVDDNILNDYRVYVHSLTLNTEMNYPVTHKDGKFMWMSSEKKTYEYWSTRLAQAFSPKDMQILRIMRMKSLMDFPSKLDYISEILKDRKHKTIIFTNTQSQADSICDHSFHSKNPASEGNLIMFKEGEIEVLAAVEQLSEGVTIPNLKSGIIMHTFANNRKASQKIGRMLRLNPDETASIHVLCYTDTVDLDWVTNALKDLNQDKIIWL